jgi:uncharacterized protein YukE
VADLSENRAAYQTWLRDQSGWAWRAATTYVEALEAEVERLNRELDNMRAMWDKDSAARHRHAAEVERLRKALRRIAAYTDADAPAIARAALPTEGGE